MKWIRIEDEMPKGYVAVLTLHEDDLYPVVAWWMNDDWILWFRETEGPEDVIMNGRLDQLYRPPTHWMPLPHPPKEE